MSSGDAVGFAATIGSNVRLSPRDNDAASTDGNNGSFIFDRGVKTDMHSSKNVVAHLLWFLFIAATLTRDSIKK